MDRPRKAKRVLKRAFMAVSAMCVLMMVFSWRLITSDEIHAGQRIRRELSERGPEQQEQQKQQEEKGMRLRMIHRNAHDSPFREQWETRLELLKSLVRHDRRRLAGFSSFMESTIPSSSFAEAPDYSPEEGRDRSGYGMARTPIFSGAFVGSGQYFIDLQIGTPPKRVLLIADTGSDLIWVNCRRHSQNSGARAFDAHTSSTFSPISCTAEECQFVPAPAQATCSLRHPTSCEYMYMYSDQSDSVGIFAYETVTINTTGSNRRGMRIPNVAFGCSDTTHGGSFMGADGVIGLGQGKISFTSQLGYMYEDKFSYCLVNHLKPNDEPSTSSNYLVFGDPNPHYLRLRLQHTPILKMPIVVPDTYYYLDIRGVNVNGERLSIPRSAWEVDSAGNGGTIIDSGTTLSYVLNPAYRLILATFERLVTYPRLNMDPFDLCFNSSGIADLRLPDFSIDFEGGARFHPAVDNYFMEAAEGVKCLGILESSSPYGFNVIGNVMQQDFFFEFDRRSSRLGFARTDCSRH